MFGQRLKQLRLEKKMTQKELADRTGLSFHSINSYESNRREPNSKAMAILERFFGVTGEYLRGESDERQPLFTWDDTENIEMIVSGFPQQMTDIVRLLRTRTSLEQKMVFDILVELRHVLATKHLSEVQKQATLLLLQEMFSTSTFFADACAAAMLDHPDEKKRLEKGRLDAIDKTAHALSVAMKNITQEQLVIE